VARATTLLLATAPLPAAATFGVFGRLHIANFRILLVSHILLFALGLLV
jgi:hypothetical protein